MKRLLCAFLGAVLLLCVPVCAASESEDPSGLELLQGSYVELFPVISDETYRYAWLNELDIYAASLEQFNLYYGMVTADFMREPVGPEAVKAYTDGGAGMNCFFRNDIVTLTVSGSTVSGTDADGEEIFCHEYRYLTELTLDDGAEEGLPLAVYESTDKYSGLFTYFAFTPDSTQATGHIEFRYSDTLEGLDELTEGPLAYWFAYGIDAAYDDALVEQIISLLVYENLRQYY